MSGTTYDAIPEELRSLRQWVCWREEERVGKNGAVTTTKVPINARSRSGAFASSTNPETWSTFERAADKAGTSGYDGIGFVFTTDDPYIGIDLDGDFDGPENALDVVERIGTYAETSPSGAGIHIVGRGTLPDVKGRHPKGVGVFAHSRYFTFTGRVLEGFETITDIQAGIDHYWPIWFPERPKATHPTMMWNADDVEIIKKLESSKNHSKFEALYYGGDVAAYGGNDSEADLALLSLITFYTQDPTQIDRIFRGSGLYRAKWDRADYRDMTISRALERSEFYTPALNDAVGIRLLRSSGVDPETGEITDDPPAPREILIFNMTDKGNAKRLVHHAGDRLRYVPKWGTWMVWNGARWVPDALGEAMEIAKAVVETIYAEAEAIADEKASGAMKAWAMRSEGAQRLREMLNLAQSDPKIAIDHARIDADPMLLNVKNGTIDLRTGTLLAHDPDRLLTKMVPVTYDPAAGAPRWRQFLAEAMGGDAALVEYLQRAVGYSLTGDVTERKMFICHGPTTTGKSTFIDVIHELLGDYAKRSPNELMVARRPGDTSIPHEAAQLVGIRFTWVSETGEFDRLDESRVKDLVSGDVISARLLHQNLFEFRPQFKLWAGTNHKPNVRATDDAVWRRINLIPFVVKRTEEEIDRYLIDRLREEMPGILAWAVRGCIAWQQVGMGAPDRVRRETAEYRETMDLIGTFIRDECVIREGSVEDVQTMYATYREWSENAGERPMTKKMFSMRLKERGITADRRGRNKKYTYHGIRLRTALDGDDDLDQAEMPAWFTKEFGS